MNFVLALAEVGLAVEVLGMSVLTRLSMRGKNRSDVRRLATLK